MATATTLLATAYFLIADEPGRGDDPSGGGGVLIVVGIAVLAVLIAGGALFAVSRLMRSRRERQADTARGPLPSEEGRPWSSER